MYVHENALLQSDSCSPFYSLVNIVSLISATLTQLALEILSVPELARYMNN